MWEYESCHKTRKQINNNKKPTKLLWIEMVLLMYGISPHIWSISWSSTRKNNRDVLWGLLGNLSLHSPEGLEGATSVTLQSEPSLWLRAELADFPFCITGDGLGKGANVYVGFRNAEWEGAPSDSKFGYSPLYHHWLIRLVIPTVEHVLESRWEPQTWVWCIATGSFFWRLLV